VCVFHTILTATSSLRSINGLVLWRRRTFYILFGRTSECSFITYALFVTADVYRCLVFQTNLKFSMSTGEQSNKECICLALSWPTWKATDIDCVSNIMKVTRSIPEESSSVIPQLFTSGSPGVTLPLQSN
jgi:hypothetical protein